MKTLSKKLGLAVVCLALGTVMAAATEVKVALVPAGPHPYFAPWGPAAADAKVAFGLAAATYAVPQEWKLDLQNKLLESLAAQGYNAFGIMPGDTTGSNTTMAELASSGAVSVTIGGCTQSPSPAKFCLATDPYRSAYLGTQALIKAMGGKGAIVHFGSRLVDPNTQLRIAAINQAIKDAGPDVKLYQHVTDTDSQETGDAKINGVLAANGASIDGIYCTGYVSSVIAARALENMHNTRIKMIGIDSDPIVISAIEKGVIQGTIAQNSYGQGYIASYALNRLLNGCTMNPDAKFVDNAVNKTFIDSGIVLVTKDNVAGYQDLIKKVSNDIISSFEKNYLICK